MACLLLGSFLFLSKQAAQLNEISVLQDQSATIVIDPGHGGLDPGVVGVEGIEEKRINLEISLKLKDSLNRKGYFVVMTRETDEGLYDESSDNKKNEDMRNRIAFIEQNEPALTISIHQNSFQDASVCGPQVFYYTESKESQILAEAIQEYLNVQLSIEKPRKVKSNDSYFLLRKTTGPIVIVECGFLTNVKDAENLSEKIYQEKVAEAITGGVLRYLEENRKKM